VNSKTVIIAFVLALAVIIGIAGIRGMKFNSPPIEIFSDMVRQNKSHPQTLMSLPDGRKLAPVSGTIPFNRIEEKDLLYRLTRDNKTIQNDSVTWIKTLINPSAERNEREILFPFHE
jgi:hypothetical protein